MTKDMYLVCTQKIFGAFRNHKSYSGAPLVICSTINSCIGLTYVWFTNAFIPPHLWTFNASWVWTILISFLFIFWNIYVSAAVLEVAPWMCTADDLVLVINTTWLLFNMALAKGEFNYCDAVEFTLLSILRYMVQQGHLIMFQYSQRLILLIILHEKYFFRFDLTRIFKLSQLCQNWRLLLSGLLVDVHAIIWGCGEDNLLSSQSVWIIQRWKS